MPPLAEEGCELGSVAGGSGPHVGVKFSEGGCWEDALAIAPDQAGHVSVCQAPVDCCVGVVVDL